MTYTEANEFINKVVPIVTPAKHRAADKAILDYAKERIQNVDYSSGLETATDYTLSGKKIYEKIEAINAAISEMLEDYILKSGDTVSGDILFSTGKIDSVASGTLNIGVTNASVINIGYAGATVNIQGTTFYQNVTNLNVSDKLFTVNKGGSAGSATGTGFEIEENSLITGYVKTNTARNGWELKSPGVNYKLTFDQSGTTADRILTIPDVSGTIGTYDSSGRMIIPSKILVGDTDSSIFSNRNVVFVSYSDLQAVSAFCVYAAGYGTPLLDIRSNGDFLLSTGIHRSNGSLFFDIPNTTIYNNTNDAVIAGNDYGLYKSSVERLNWNTQRLKNGNWIVEDGDFKIEGALKGALIPDRDNPGSFRRIIYSGGVLTTEAA